MNWDIPSTSRQFLLWWKWLAPLEVKPLTSACTPVCIYASAYTDVSLWWGIHGLCILWNSFDLRCESVTFNCCSVVVTHKFMRSLRGNPPNSPRINSGWITAQCNTEVALWWYNYTFISYVHLLAWCHSLLIYLALNNIANYSSSLKQLCYFILVCIQSSSICRCSMI